MIISRIPIPALKVCDLPSDFDWKCRIFSIILKSQFVHWILSEDGDGFPFEIVIISVMYSIECDLHSARTIDDVHRVHY